VRGEDEDVLGSRADLCPMRRAGLAALSFKFPTAPQNRLCTETSEDEAFRQPYSVFALQYAGSLTLSLLQYQVITPVRSSRGRGLMVVAG
jgi:hypothetical protein